MWDMFEALPKPVQIILAFVAIALVLGLLSACVKPGMVQDVIPAHEAK